MAQGVSSQAFSRVILSECYVSRANFQVADLEIGDGEATVFGVTFILLDHVLKLFAKVLV